MTLDIEKYAREAFECLAELCAHGEPEDRLAACEAMLDRVWIPEVDALECLDDEPKTETLETADEPRD